MPFLSQLWAFLKELWPHVWPSIKEFFRSLWNNPISRRKLLENSFKNIIIIGLVVGIYYSTDNNVKLSKENVVLLMRLETMMQEKLELENSCAREAPKQQEYNALEQRIKTANQKILDLEQKLELCTLDKADSVNRRLRELNRR